MTTWGATLRRRAGLVTCLVMVLAVATTMWTTGRANSAPPTTPLGFSIATGPSADEYPAGLFAWSTPLPARIVGPVDASTVFGGDGCGSTAVPSPPNDDRDRWAVVLSGGGCPASRKVESAQAVGYDLVLVAGADEGTADGTTPGELACAPKEHAFTVTVPALCIADPTMHLIFAGSTDAAGDIPVGSEGEAVKVVADTDRDGVVDEADSCPLRPNPQQGDRDQDSVGDACEPPA